jgi:hypothetical protein
MQENFESFIEGKEYNSKIKTNILQDYENTKKKEKKYNTFDLMKFISSQPKETSSVEELEKQKKYLEKIRKDVNSNQYEKVKNTIDFFEENIKYFTQHPLEFQRLIGQLELNERKLFTHHVFTYYYADVLIQLKQLEKKQEEEEETLEEDEDKCIQQLKKQYFYSHHSKSIEFDYKKVSKVYHYILKNVEKLKQEESAFHNLMIGLNSHETIMLEDLLFK